MEIFKLLGTISLEGAEKSKEQVESISESGSEAASVLSNVGGKLQSVGGSISNAGQKITKAMAVAGTAVVGAGAAIYGFASKAAAAGDNIDKMSQKIGISREAYQELDFICSQSGTSVDTLQAGMKTLTAAMDGVASGTKSNIEQFEALGISVTNADGSLRSQESVMWETMSALQGMENQTEKARLATELFGRSGSELMPLLNGEVGSIDELKQKAHELGLIMSDEAIDSSVEFTDTIDQTKRSLSAAAMQIGVALLPYIQKFAQYVIDNMPKIREAISKVSVIFGNVASAIGNVITWFQNLSPEMQKIIGIIAIVIAAIGPVLTVLGGIISSIGTVITVFSALNPVVIAVVAVIAALVAAGVLLYKNWDTIKAYCIDLGNKISEIWGNIKSKISSAVDSIKSTVTSKFNAVKSTASNIFNAVKTAITNPVEAAKTAVGKVIDTIKGFFNFSWSLPKLKMPHFSVTGGFSLNPLSVPKFSIDWYAKAMNAPMIMEQPTVFGMNGLGQLMAGGEAGSEVVSGTNTLMTMIQNAVRSETDSAMDDVIKGITAIYVLLDKYIPGMTSQQVVLDNGVLVGALAPALDKELGNIYKMRKRGV